MADDTLYLMPWDWNSQYCWAVRTFGPGLRDEALAAHIRKELVEVEQAAATGDSNLTAEEWMDVIILASEAAMRRLVDAGEEDPATALLETYHSKMKANEARVWPDWRKAKPGQPIEHDRSGESQP